MELQRLLTWICFAFCLGLTAGGVLLFFRLKARLSLSSVRYFQYYLVMIYAYAYYAIWSYVFIEQFFSSSDRDSELVESVSNLLYLVSTPFLLMGLIMLVLWVRQMAEKKSIVVLIGGIALVLMVAVLFIFYMAPLTPGISEAMTLISILVIVFVASQLYSSKLKYLNSGEGRIMASLLVGFACIQYLSLTVYMENYYVELVYLFLFFLLNSAMGAFFVYSGRFPEVGFRQEPESFPMFVEKFGITPREQEVIMEIYKGKTNREIAETLFVTVQTIKDHTHRIYQKTDVRNRNQLASLLRTIHRNRE